MSFKIWGLPVMGSYISVILVVTRNGCIHEMLIHLSLAMSPVAVGQKEGPWPILGSGLSSSAWRYVPAHYLRAAAWRIALARGCAHPIRSFNRGHQWMCFCRGWCKESRSLIMVGVYTCLNHETVLRLGIFGRHIRLYLCCEDQWCCKVLGPESQVTW